MKISYFIIVFLIIPFCYTPTSGITQQTTIIFQKEQLLNETKDRQIVLYSENSLCWEQSDGIYYMRLTDHVVQRISHVYSIISKPMLSNNIMAWIESENGSSFCKIFNLTSNNTIELKQKPVFGISQNTALCFSNNNFYLYYFATSEYRLINADIKDINQLYMTDDYIVWRESLNPNTSLYCICYYDIEKQEKRIISEKDSNPVAPYLHNNSIVWAEVKYEGNWYGNASIILFDINKNQSQKIISNISFDPFPHQLSIFNDIVIYKEGANSSLMLYNISQNKTYTLTAPAYSINIWNNNIVYETAKGIYLIVFEFVDKPIPENIIQQTDNMLLPVALILLIMILAAILIYYILRRKKSNVDLKIVENKERTS